ncbi:retrovirus-related pol polyprotein from transposon TNT 1-94 [Tanacetum coccineum]
MTRIQPADDKAETELKYDSEAISEMNMIQMLMINLSILNPSVQREVKNQQRLNKELKKQKEMLQKELETEQVGLAGDLGSTNDVLIPLVHMTYSIPLNTAYRSSDTACMTRSSNKDLVQPFENPKQVFRSSKKLSKTHSLDHLSLTRFNIISNLKDQFKEEETEAMGETMEEYMCKTRGDYGSGFSRPKIDDKTHFELKGQFIKELRDNTFSGSDHEDANEHIEKVLEIVDLFHIPEIPQDQIMIRAFPMSLTGATSHWLRNEPSGSIITWDALKKKFMSKYCPPVRTTKKMEEINNFQQESDETLYQAWERFKELLMRCPQHYLTDMQEVTLFYKGLEVPTRQILDSKGAIPTMTATDVRVAIQDMVEHSPKWHDGTSTRTRSTETSDGLAAIQA